jgi:hypothetical protein
MAASGNREDGKEPVAVPPSAGTVFFPHALRVNPEVVAAVLGEATERHARVRSDAAHQRRYVELHHRIWIAQRSECSEAA